MDYKLAEYIGIIPIRKPKPPKKLYIFKALLILVYDFIKIPLWLLKVRMNKSRILLVYFDIGKLPDNAGIGLKNYDDKHEQMTKNCLGLSVKEYHQTRQ